MRRVAKSLLMLFCETFIGLETGKRLWMLVNSRQRNARMVIERWCLSVYMVTQKSHAAAVIEELDEASGCKPFVQRFCRVHF